MTRIIALTESSDPAAVANQIVIYSKDVSGVTQFFARLSDGTIVQLTGVSSGGGDRGWYGTGVEGDDTTAGAGGGDDAWTEDRFFNNYTITAGDTLLTGGNRLHCSGTLTIQSTAFLDNSGENASGVNGGAGGQAGGDDGGGGGGSGGVMVICARHIVAAAGSIRCRGGDGADSPGGGGRRRRWRSYWWSHFYRD